MNVNKLDYDVDDALLATFRRQRDILCDVLREKGQVVTIDDIAKLTHFQSQIVEMVRDVQYPNRRTPEQRPANGESEVK